MSIGINRIAAAIAATVTLAGCGVSTGNTAGSPTQTQPSRSAGPVLSGGITVFAASSLKEVFTKLAAQFEAANPGTTVTFSFAASSALAAQIESGAPADVFAAASVATMDLVAKAGLAGSPRTFAKNTMEIAVPPTNPAGITGLADLARAGVKVALCQPVVPCGTSARKVFGKAKLKVTPATLEPDVKSVLTKVELDEADAGLVYVTDVLAAGSKVHGILIPAAENAATTYPIATIGTSGDPSLARAFVAYVLSPAGLAALGAAGFARP